MYRKIFSLLVIALCTANAGFSQQLVQPKSANAGVPKGTAAHINLYNEIAKADSAMFHAFNTCDTTNYRKFIAADLEFYHDLGGLTVGAEKELQSINEMCARGNHIRRELVKNTLEVYPLKGYGAVEIGMHRFYHTNKGQQEKISGTYKFVQVWQFKDGQWKLSRVISYDHNEIHND